MAKSYDGNNAPLQYFSGDSNALRGLLANHRFGGCNADEARATLWQIASELPAFKLVYNDYGELCESTQALCALESGQRSQEMLIQTSESHGLS
jgi:hypothetical protein